MKDYSKRIAALSPEQRLLLELKLKQHKPSEALPLILPRDPHEAHTSPLSLDQERLWFIYQLDPASAAYNINIPLRLSGALDIRALTAALNEIVRRHEILRTYFVQHNGQPAQVVAPALTLEIPVVDLRHLPEAERAEEEKRLLRDDALLPFDLSSLPLVRALLTQTGDTEHGLLLSMHHTVTDWWSSNIIQRELSILYSSFVAGQSSPLPQLPIQYADFAAWQRRWLQKDGLEKLTGYWETQLAGAPYVLELPGDRPRLPTQTLRGAAYRFGFSQTLYEQLKALSRAEGTTIFMTLLAGFDILLARYSGQDDFLVGSPSANRNRAGTESLIGYFLNTLVLRAQLSDNPTAREFLQRIRKVVLDAYTYQDMPFGDLVQRLKPERDLSRMPLVQVSFVFLVIGDQSAIGDLSTQEVEGLKFAPIIFDTDLSRYDLTLGLWESAEGLVGHFEYNADLFDEATMERMYRHLEGVLEAMVEQPDAQVLELPLLRAEEREQLLIEWNQTARPYELDDNVPSRIAEQSRRRTDATAIMWGDERLSYAELNGRANQLAHRLRRLGVGAEVCVGLCVERSVAMAVGVFGILKSGGAFVPLEPDYPVERVVWQARDSGMQVVLVDEAACESGLAERLAAEGVRVLCLDTEREALDKESEAEPEWEIRPEQLAYIIYTSGSTGRPKGVMVEHRHLTNTLLGAQDIYRLSPDDVVPCVASFAFDIFLFELLVPLLAGATCLLLPHRHLLDPKSCADTLERVTCMHAVPALMREVVAAAEWRGWAIWSCASAVRGRGCGIAGVGARHAAGVPEGTSLYLVWADGGDDHMCDLRDTQRRAHRAPDGGRAHRKRAVAYL